MATNVEVNKTAGESVANLIRRFTKRVQGSGVLTKVRKVRYSGRKISEKVKQKKTLKKLARRTEVDRLIKLGKLPDNNARNEKN